MKSSHDITSRLAQLATVLDGFDPWYDLDYDSEMEGLENEFAELRLHLPTI
jgi:hypothetical protein